MIDDFQKELDEKTQALKDLQEKMEGSEDLIMKKSRRNADAEIKS